MVDKRKKVVVEQASDSDFEDEIFAHKTKKLKIKNYKNAKVRRSKCNVSVGKVGDNKVDTKKS